MAGDLYRDNGLTVDFRACRVWVDDEEIQISAIRFRILSLLIENAGRPLSVDEIMRHAWQGEDYDTGLVRWHIARLRKELRDSPPTRIVQVRGFGYRFDVQESASPPELIAGPDEPLLRSLVSGRSTRCCSAMAQTPKARVTLRAQPRATTLRCLR
ncbi:MAG: winged helix-turn-helix transcriptional regulator [Chloroflexi bacterium]|nr:winged helix-turn-helix transcriptional regulator [Chloroflexota bacterium]